MFSLKQKQFLYSSTPEAAALRLKEVLRRPHWSSIVATVTPARVELCRGLSPLFFNSFNPIFDGRFEPAPTGAILVGRFRFSWFVFAFLIVFFGAIAFNVVHTYLQPEHRPGYVSGWRDRELAWHLEFLGLALLVPVVGWLIGTPNRNAIVRAIEESL